MPLTTYCLLLTAYCLLLTAHCSRGFLLTPHQAKAYSVPQGGLFPLVATPHYLFEIVAWLGIALAAQQLNALLVTAGMAAGSARRLGGAT